MQLFDNPFIEVFIPLVLGLLLPLQFVNVTFLTLNHAPSWFLIPYMLVLIVILFIGYRLANILGIMGFAYTGFIFILHRTTIANNAPDYTQAAAYLFLFIVIAFIQGKYRYQFWFMLLGATTGITLFLAVAPAQSAVGAAIGAVIGFVLSRIEPIKRISDVVFNIIAALVTVALAMTLIDGPWKLLHLSSSLGFLQDVLILGGLLFQLWQIIREARHVGRKSERTVVQANLAPNTQPDIQKKSTLQSFLLGVQTGYSFIAKFISPVLTIALVIYITLTIKSASSANFLPLPAPVQSFMNDYTTYTSGYLNVSDTGQPVLRYYAKFDGGADVFRCPHVTCTVVSHYPPGQRLENMMILAGDAVNNVTSWVEVLDHAQLAYVNVSNTIQEDFNEPLLLPTPTRSPTSTAKQKP